MALTESFSPLIVAVNDNPRLRIGLWLIVGIAWIFCLSLLREETQRAANEFQSLAKKIGRIQVQSSQNEWTARVEPTQTLQLELESRLWREATIGLAQATFQDWLNQVVQQSSLTRAVVIVAAQDENTPEKNTSVKAESVPILDIWKVSAKVGFEFTPKSMYAFMGRIEGHSKQIVVESIVVRSSISPRVETVLVAYFQKPAGVEKLPVANSGKPDEIRR